MFIIIVISHVISDVKYHVIYLYWLIIYVLYKYIIHIITKFRSYGYYE